MSKVFVSFVFSLALWVAVAQTQTHAEAQAGFSPNGQALPLVLSSLQSAKKTLDMAAYRFTNKKIRSAVFSALKSGVKVRLLIDGSYEKPKDWQRVLDFLGPVEKAGAEIRVEKTSALFHNKYCIVDKSTVETGSFNYTVAAEKDNHENVLVLWNEPELAARYQENFEQVWANAEQIGTYHPPQKRGRRSGLFGAF